MYSERQLIDKIAAMAAAAGPVAGLGIGDDCAVLSAPDGRQLVITTDTLVEGVHFDLAWHPPRLLGRKAAAVNISDVAAMGASPGQALLSIALPATIDEGLVDDFLDGFMACLAEFSVRLIGGDTVASPGGIVLSITVIGAGETLLYRQGAAVGDAVLIAGQPGLAAAGLAVCRRGFRDDPRYATLVSAHLDPRPQVALGSLLAASGLVSAMLDTSDGLATDLAHICRQSGVGAVLDRRLLPVSEQMAGAAGDMGQDPLRWMLAGGEDYLLLLTVDRRHVAAVQDLAREKAGIAVYRIGEIVEGSGVVLRDGDDVQDITYGGYEHLGKADPAPSH